MGNSDLLGYYLRKYRADGLKEITIATAENTLILFIEWCGDRELKEFTSYDIYDYNVYAPTNIIS
jgi:hypothetical protein